MKEVKPSESCKVVGWKDLPHAGAEVLQVESEKRAQQVIQWRKHQESQSKQMEDLREIEKKREAERKKYEDYRMKKLDTGMRHLKYGRFDFHVREKETQLDDGPPKVSFVVKADVDGSLDAIMSCLDTYHSNEVDMVPKTTYLIVITFKQHLICTSIDCKSIYRIFILNNFPRFKFINHIGWKFRGFKSCCK